MSRTTIRFSVVTLFTFVAMVGAMERPHHADSQPAADQQPGRQQMMQGCDEMQQHMQQHQQRMQRMEQQLAGKMAAMEQAQGQAKVDAMAEVIRELVDQRQQMSDMRQQMMQRMMQHMGEHMGMEGEDQAGMMQCPMMQMRQQEGEGRPDGHQGMQPGIQHVPGQGRGQQQ